MCVCHVTHVSLLGVKTFFVKNYNTRWAHQGRVVALDVTLISHQYRRGRNKDIRKAAIFVKVPTGGNRAGYFKGASWLQNDEPCVNSTTSWQRYWQLQLGK